MKGTVVSSWVVSCRKLFGDSLVNKAMEANNVSSDHVFTPFEDVEDKVATGIVDYIGNSVGKNHKEIWGTMGQENIKTFSQVINYQVNIKNSIFPHIIILLNFHNLNTNHISFFPNFRLKMIFFKIFIFFDFLGIFISFTKKIRILIF